MDKPTLDARFRIVFVLWASLLSGVTLFAALVWALGSGVLSAPVAPTLDPSLAGKLLLLVPVAMVAGIVHRNGEIRRDQAAEAALAAYRTRVLVASALQEGGALLGLTLCLLAGRPSWALGVWAVAAAAMVLGRPRRDDLDRLTR